MGLNEKQLLLCLVASHVIVESALYCGSLVVSKHQWSSFLKQALFVTSLAYLLAGMWTNWALLLAVFISHFAIDSANARFKCRGPKAFLRRQAMHAITFVTISIVCTGDKTTLFWVERFGNFYPQALVLLSGFLLSVYLGGHLIGLAVQPLLAELEEALKADESEITAVSRGFKHGGQLIGQLERALIFLFVVIGQPAATGFLIAAKSVFRFGELREHKHRMEAEYIIIGTLMSFGYGMLVAYLTQCLFNMYWQ